MGLQQLETELGRLAQAMVMGLIDRPEEARIVERWRRGTDSMLLELTAVVVDSDVPKVVGKAGLNVRSVRMILMANAAKSGVRFEFHVSGKQERGRK